MIIQYITFENNEEFVEWQKLEERKVNQIQPFMNSIDIGIDSEDTSAINSTAEGRAKATPGIFVTYMEED